MDYKEIYNIWYKEVNNKDLVELEPDFYDKLAENFKKFNKELEKYDPNSLHKKLLEAELNNIKLMVKEIYLSRFNKILDTIKSGSEININALTNNELDLYNNVFKKLKNYLKKIDLILEGRTSKFEKKKIISEYIIVKFNDKIPEFVGNDNIIYGPFEKGDIATLPIKIAKPLLERETIQIIEINKKIKNN